MCFMKLHLKICSAKASFSTQVMALQYMEDVLVMGQ